MSALMPTYARLPVTFSHGEGVYLFDGDGRRYLDGISGIGVNALGHAHPALVTAVAEQAARVIHTSNLYHIEQQQQLAQALGTASGMTACFFGNSGAEANEAAIKLARLYGHGRGVERPNIIVLEDSFHGRTLATLSATGNRKIQAGFEPLVSGFVRAKRNDIDALTQIAEHNQDVVAVLLEPIQGEGGIHVLDHGYLQAVRALCSERGWLLMVDEVQSGNGRTGTYFAYQGLGITPDVVTTAKGLGNGLPIGACLAQGIAAEVLSAGKHGSTYGGNPLCCAAALAVVDAIHREQLMPNATAMGDLIKSRLGAHLKEQGVLREARGRGLMLGFELELDCSTLVADALAAGLLINVTAGNTLRLLPPLIIGEDEAVALADGLANVVAARA
ncbi:MAG: aspartate aminotransferase family protein [Pseudomonadota bacterium]